MKKDLIIFLDDIFKTLGFKRKGNNWIINGDEINKVINLQKSQYSNAFYINYGYIINSIPLKDMMHIYNRVTSLNEQEREEINLFLNLESDISDEKRKEGLKKILQNQLINKIQSIETEDDLLLLLKNRPHLNDIPLAVKNHFKLTV